MSLALGAICLDPRVLEINFKSCPLTTSLQNKYKKDERNLVISNKGKSLKRSKLNLAASYSKQTMNKKTETPRELQAYGN